MRDESERTGSAGISLLECNGGKTASDFFSLAPVFVCSLYAAYFWGVACSLAQRYYGEI